MRFSSSKEHRDKLPRPIACCHSCRCQHARVRLCAARSRPAAGQRSLTMITLAHESRKPVPSQLGSYGRPRMTEELKGNWTDIGHAPRWQIDCARNGRSVSGTRKHKVHDRHDHKFNIAPTCWIVTHGRRPNLKMAGDISYVWTVKGWLYLAVILDLHSRVSFGWAVSNRYEARILERQALNMAIRIPCAPKGCIHHTDRGSPKYCSSRLSEDPASTGDSMSMSGKGIVYDNAASKTFGQTPLRRADLRAIMENTRKLRGDSSNTLMASTIHAVGTQHWVGKALRLRNEGRLKRATWGGISKTATGPSRPSEKNVVFFRSLRLWLFTSRRILEDVDAASKSTCLSRRDPPPRSRTCIQRQKSHKRAVAIFGARARWAWQSNALSIAPSWERVAIEAWAARASARLFKVRTQFIPTNRAPGSPSGQRPHGRTRAPRPQGRSKSMAMGQRFPVRVLRAVSSQSLKPSPDAMLKVRKSCICAVSNCRIAGQHFVDGRIGPTFSVSQMIPDNRAQAFVVFAVPDIFHGKKSLCWRWNRRR